MKIYCPRNQQKNLKAKTLRFECILCVKFSVHKENNSNEENKWN